MNKKIFTWFMTLCMVFALFPTFALAAENDNGIHYGYYKDGQWQESTVQDSDFGIDGLQSISKTAAPVAGQDNTYDITLKVVMSQTTTTAPGAAATVLVVDTSGSTDWCSECGFEPEFNLIPLGTQYHKKTCSRYNNSSFETRLDAEKTAALEFVDTFSGCVKNGVYTENTALTRYVAIVEFNSYGSVTQEWVNVATKDGYDKARSAVNKLSANGGTNLDDGLADANTLLGRDTVKNISAKNVIALTDGVPTYAMKNGNRIGDGTGGSSAINDQTKATATTLKTKANLYTVCFGAAGEVTYPGGPTVGKFLEESIATPASADGKTKYAFNAANADELYNAFAAITDTIVNGINAGTVNDSIPAGVEQTAGTITPNETTGSFTWELNPDAALVETSGDTTTYTYSYTYRVKIDPTTDNAKAGNWIPTNGRTTLTVGDKTVDFGIPAVKAKYYEIHYFVYNDATQSYEERTDLTKTLLSANDDISSYNTPLSKTGYTFSGWFTAEDRNEASAWTPDKMPAENINVYGAFNANDYTITYMVKGDDGTYAKDHEATLKYGDTIADYSPASKDGYTFSGWYNEEALNNAWSKPETMPANNITVYGEYTANEYTITYMVKGDDGTYAKDHEAAFKFGDTIADYSPASKEGYTFSGWYKEEALTNAWSKPETMPAGNITVYGAFNVNDYKINYIVNNDSSFNKTAVVKYGDAIPGYAPEKTGYTFNGWYKEAALTNKWTAPATMPAEDITVYGAFTANDYTITYMVKGDDGVYAKNNEVTLKFGAKVDDYTPTEKEGHTFSGWYNEEALTNAWSKPETMPASNITVYGAYTANDYTITYMVKGDDGNYAENNKVTLKFGAEITGYSPAEKEGHSFTGWFEDEALTNAWNKPETMPAKNIVVYGGYITNGYTITYMVKGDDGNYAENNKIALKYGDAIPEYAPEKTGHTFSGWYHEDALTNAWAKPETMPANNITVYGAFTANDYTITYYLKNSDGGFDKDHAVTLTYGAAIQDYTPAAIKGYDFHGWYTEDALTNLWTNPGTMPDHNIDLYGEQVCVLNFDDHFAYIIGYEDGTVRPQANITRAEVATIFFRLLTDDSRAINKTSENPFSDVHAGQWYNNAISTLANMKILNGYNDGTFRPNQPITRAEMATIISAFANLTENTKTFTDIEGHWAQKYIELAAGNGWITGYEDGTFRPNNEITRAETMTMINRVMKRVPKDETCLLDGMTTYPDCVSGQWYYIAVQEATNSHYFQREVGATDGSEKWLELRENFDWSQLEK